MSWRDHSLNIINDRITTLTNNPDWETLSHQEKQQQIKAAVDSDYPYSQRKGWAYQSWLNARADIFAWWGIPTRRKATRPPANRKGWHKPIAVAPGQLSFFDGAIANPTDVQP